MKFREHRSTLADSMETCVDLRATRAAICEHMNGRNALGLAALTPLELSVDWYCDGDPRIGWEPVFIVRARGGVVGFTDSPVH